MQSPELYLEVGTSDPNDRGQLICGLVSKIGIHDVRVFCVRETRLNINEHGDRLKIHLRAADPQIASPRFDVYTMSHEMDFFAWHQLDSYFGENETIPSLENLLIPEANDIASLTWTDYFMTPYPSLDRTPAFTQLSGSSFSSNQDSCLCQDGKDDFQNNAAENEDKIAGSSRSSGQPRTQAHSSSRDPVLNRIQRRRTQNRNPQRIYRQRRMEERQRFENRAIAAKDTSKQLKQHLEESHSVVACLRYQVQQLEAENAMLRGGGEHFDLMSKNFHLSG